MSTSAQVSGVADTVALAPTVLGASPPGAGGTQALGAAQTGTGAGTGTIPGRTTVLPRAGAPKAPEAAGPGADARVRYEPVRTLGAGGMGEVELAQDNDIGRLIALKRLLPQVTDEQGIARFADEVRTIGSLEHPNIVPIHDVGIDDQGRYYFVMKYVEGETVEQIIERLAAGDADYHARYPFQRRVEIFAGLLHALELAHDRGVVHRDVKPANVMVGRYGEVVLMDWGIAKPVGPAGGTVALPAPPTKGARRIAATQVGALIGTPAYMSPEQAAGDTEGIGPASDLYSACVVLHELVTCRHYLGERKSVDDVLSAILREDYPFLRLWYADPVQGLPPASLIHFIAHGLRKMPGERFASAREMLDELQRMHVGKHRVFCHVSLMQRMVGELGRLIDRRPYLALFSFVAMLALVVLGAWSALSRLI